ncbi:Uncharacterised protein [Enterobacter ludwigii]|jgi:hypothetical protein|nr:Uncharacterised protein [Enterobacter ludwigii]SAH47193.1 Uncharacterised protein [Enterobacter ludwigii]
MTYGITPANARCRVKRTALSVAMPGGYHRPQDVLMEIGENERRKPV